MLAVFFSAVSKEGWENVPPHWNAVGNLEQFKFYVNITRPANVDGIPYAYKPASPPPS
jgi:hypothetical protein